MLRNNSKSLSDNFRGSFNSSAHTTRVNTRDQTLNNTAAQNKLSSQLSRKESHPHFQRSLTRSATPQVCGSKSEFAKGSANATTKVSTAYPSAQSLHPQPQQQQVSMMDARVQAPNLDTEIHWISRQSPNVGLEFSQTPKNLHNSGLMQSNYHNRTAERPAKAAFRETDFLSNDRFHRSRERMLGRKYNDASPALRSRENSVDSRSAGRRTFSNLKNQSQFSIGHSQSKPDLSTHLNIQETFAVDAAWRVETQGEHPKSTAQNDFSMNKIFQNHNARPFTPKLSKHNNKSQLNLRWNEDSANLLRNSSVPKAHMKKTQSCTNLSHKVERVIKNYPDSAAVQEAHAMRAKSHLGNRSTPGLLQALIHVNNKNISKTSTLHGRLDLAHEEFSNSGNF